MSHIDFQDETRYSARKGSFPAPNPDSKLAARLAECKAEGRAALIGYLPVGYPSVDESIEAAIEMGRNGVDIIRPGHGRPRDSAGHR